jgi:hypothetical protein
MRLACTLLLLDSPSVYIVKLPFTEMRNRFPRLEGEEES